ncbi:MAG: hypothetical protein HKP58_19970 [Desulfatitalea sp.]|nr:hypothetical protein [Desulfatitalea sp.]NNK02696.1 hypothetical protein [Desulfatitalea sp.]
MKTDRACKLEQEASNTLSPPLFGIMALMLVGLPLIGIYLSGTQVAPFLKFPPLTRYVQHAPFSWPYFAFYALLDAVLLFFSVYLLRQRPGTLRPPAVVSRRPLPRWGWSGLFCMLGGWFLAWTRFGWFSAWQAHTFCLPWIGYIILVNALCVKRRNTSLMTDAPCRFAVLILVSTLFWWVFEYLNRFVQNWYYVGVDELGPLAYTAFASLAFATVLPAVLSTYRVLLTFSIFGSNRVRTLKIKIPWPRATAGVILAGAAAGLALIGVYPDIFFSLLWISPLLIISALQALSGRETIFSSLRCGDWRHLICAALAALICGFFWELWNIGSLARWKYSLPYVERYHLFAMPIIGYGGYLPFGLACLAIGGMMFRRRHLYPDAA